MKEITDQNFLWVITHCYYFLFRHGQENHLIENHCFLSRLRRFSKPIPHFAWLRMQTRAKSFQLKGLIHSIPIKIYREVRKGNMFYYRNEFFFMRLLIFRNENDVVVPRTLLRYIPVRDTCMLRGGHLYCPMF